MDSVNALELRQSLGRVITRLRRTKQPLLLKKGKEPVAVLISIEDYEERFADKDAADRRRELLRGMDALARPSVDERTGAEILQELRGGR
jgi:prevent-host-death family protein